MRERAALIDASSAWYSRLLTCAGGATGTCVCPVRTIICHVPASGSALAAWAPIDGANAIAAARIQWMFLRANVMEWDSAES